MGRIQTNIGLITGMPIGDTVDALMDLAAKPRDMLLERTNAIQDEQLAVTELSAMLLSVKYITDNLGKQSLFDKREVTSSDPSVLSASVTVQPPLGTYQFTPLRMAQNQQLLSSGFESDTDSIGGGKLTFRFGSHVQRSASVGLLNGGEGVVRGHVLITDRSGARAEIDLSTVETVDDVLEAINGNHAIDVTAVSHGDRIRLIDNTGQTQANLRVQEVGGGATAASLGLGDIDVAAAVADGDDLIRLYENLDLDQLHDGSGVRTDIVFPEIEFTLRDGTTGVVDFSEIKDGSSEIKEEKTLGDVLAVFNAAAPGKLKAEIAPDGDRLMVTDMTQGEGTFQLTNAFDHLHTLSDLGLGGREAVDGVITGGRMLSGAGTVLLSSLNGGRGFGQLGTLELNDREGASDTVSLAGAETLEEVIQRINQADVGIVAQVNQARNGIELLDTTGGHAGNLIVASADETSTAEKLGIAVDDDVTGKNSGDMHLQVIALNTKLSDLNGGAGVARGTFTIQDTSTKRVVINLRDEEIETVGDVIQQINRSEAKVYAEINETGDGIRLVDTGGGGAPLMVFEGDATTARGLNLLQYAEEVEVDGQLTQVIDGSMTHVIELDEDVQQITSLDDLRSAINGLKAGVTAATFVDGSDRPFRLSLTSDRAGKIGALVVDTSEIGFSMEETVQAQDALLAFGNTKTSAGVLVSSSSNTFRSVLPGVALTVEQASQQPVTVTVARTDSDLVANVETLVANYNRFREKLNELTAYDVETDTRSLLTGDATALRLDSDLSRLISGRFFGAGPIQSLAEVGINIKSDGTLDFDAEALKSRYAEDPDAVEQFFTAEEFGVSDKFDRMIEQMSGEDVSLLAQRFKTLQDKINRNAKRVDFMNERLEAERNRLFMQFYRMELVIGKMQAGLSALEAIQPLSPITGPPRSVSG